MKLKQLWIEYCKTTDKPYSYMRYTQLYPNITQRKNLNYKNLSVEEKKAYHRARKKKGYISAIDRIKKIREEQWIVI